MLLLEKLHQSQNPFDKMPDETVLYTRVQFQEYGKDYVYCFLKMKGVWYSTGKQAYSASSQDLFRWFLEKYKIHELWQVETCLLYTSPSPRDS